MGKNGNVDDFWSDLDLTPPAMAKKLRRAFGVDTSTVSVPASPSPSSADAGGRSDGRDGGGEYFTIPPRPDTFEQAAMQAREARRSNALHTAALASAGLRVPAEVRGEVKNRSRLQNRRADNRVQTADAAADTDALISAVHDGERTRKNVDSDAGARAESTPPQPDRGRFEKASAILGGTRVVIAQDGTGYAADVPLGDADADRRRESFDIPKIRPEKPPADIKPFEYSPENPLIELVEVSPWPSSYSFYERFRSDAEKYFPMQGKECPYVHFFSYMPQYHQLTAEQLGYYLWWRENLRCGEFIRTEISYILLCLYEIINLPETIPPKQGVELICRIWRGYCESIPGISKYISEWLCDYCLVHRLPAPHDELASIPRADIGDCTLREFYIGHGGSLFGGDAGENTADIGQMAEDICRTLSSYDWRCSKYIDDSNRDFFTRHMTAALRAAFKASEQSPSDKYWLDISAFPMVTRSRDAFSGSLCSFRVKRRIDVTFRSLRAAHELRPVITDTVKFAENNVRFCLGIKPRFSVKALPDALKEPITAYFAPLRSSIRKSENLEAAEMRAARIRRGEELPPEAEKQSEFEHLYEARHAELVPERARQIEQSSWSVTDRLVAAFGDDGSDGGGETPDGATAAAALTTAAEDAAEESAGGREQSLSGGEREAPSAGAQTRKTPTESTAQAAKQQPVPPQPTDGSVRSDTAKKGARILLRGDHTAADNSRDFAAAAKAAGMLPDTLAELINDMMYDELDDICVEKTDVGYSIVEFYREEVAAKTDG